MSGSAAVSRAVPSPRDSGRSAGRRLEEDVHRPAQLADVPYGIGKFEPGVEAGVSVLDEPDPETEPVDRDRDGVEPVLGAAASPRSPSNADKVAICSLWAACRCWSSSAS